MNLPREPRSSRLVLIADTSRDALRRRVAEVRDAIGETSAWMLAERFGEGAHRVAIVGANREQLLAGLTTAHEQLAKADRLRRARGSVYFGEASAPPGPMVFLFPGQGSQHEGMLAELCVAFPTLHRWFEDLERAVADVESSVMSMVYGNTSTPERLFGLGGGAQIAFIAGIALHEILTTLGLKADAMLGHSSGEHAALVTSGTFSHTDRSTIFAAAHDVMLQARDLPKPDVREASVAVSGCPRELLMQLIDEMPGRLFLAMDNCPSQSVLAGTADAIENATARIQARGAICVPLAFEHAYHTPLFHEWQRRLEAIYRSAISGRGHTPLYSCAAAGPYPEEAESARALASAQWSSVVRFGDTIERLYGDGYRTFLEVGPGNKLTGFVDDVLRKRPHVAVSACSSSRPDLEQLHHMAAELFVNGYAIDAARFTLAPPQTPGIVEHHFALMQEFVATQERVFAMFENAMGNRPRREIARTFTLESDPILRDHSLGQCLPVIPFTMSLELAMEATGANEITDVSGYRWLALDQGKLDTAISIDGDRVRIFEVDRNKKHLAFECRVSPGAPHPPFGHLLPARGEKGLVSAKDFYDNYAFHGPLFQCIKEILSVSATTIEAKLERTKGEATILDTAGQLVALTLLEQGRKNFGIFPFRLKRLTRWNNDAKTLYAQATVEWNDRGTTNANIVYTDEQANVVYEIEAFEQRYLQIPPNFAQLIFGTKPKNITLTKEDIPTDFLEESWHIWARALAHRFLDRDELRAWYASPDRRQAIESLRQRITEDAWQPAAMTSGERSSTS